MTRAQGLARFDQFAGRRIGRRHHRLRGHQRRRGRSLRDLGLAVSAFAAIRFGSLGLGSFSLGSVRFAASGLGGVGLRGILGDGRNRRRAWLGGAGCGFVGGGARPGSLRPARRPGQAGFERLRLGVAAGEAGAEPCRAMAPVTESSPCSRLVTREYSRSRSLLSVSMAEASRRASFWVSLATDWICCACRVRSAAATWSRFKPSDDWLAITARITAPTAPTPHDPIRHSARRSSSSSSAKKPLSTPPVSSASKLPARWSGFLGQDAPGPPSGLPNHRANINRKCAADLNPERSSGGESVSSPGENN